MKDIDRPTVLDKRWQDWCDKVLALRGPNMGERKAESFMICMLNEQREQEFPAEARAMFQFKVGAAHARHIGLSIRPWTLLFVTSLVDTPDGLVMFLHALRRWQQLNLGQDMDMPRLSSVYPMGFPTPEQLRPLWDEQKLTKEDREAGMTGSDNYLDHVFDPSVKKETADAGADQSQG